MSAPAPEFTYDAVRKVAVARGVDDDGRAWTLELQERHDDDSMRVVVQPPDGAARPLTVTEDDFTFGEGLVSLRAAPPVRFRMQPLYLKKLRGFTRGNIPTPDVPGPSLP
jgi:hypothetical protein